MSSRYQEGDRVFGRKGPDPDLQAAAEVLRDDLIASGGVDGAAGRLAYQLSRYSVRRTSVWDGREKSEQLPSGECPPTAPPSK